MQHLTLENIEKQSGGKPYKLDVVVRLFQQEMEAATGKKLNWDEILAPTDMKAFLGKQLSAIEQGGEQKWYSAIRATHPLRTPILNNLSEDDKQKFNELYQSIYVSYAGPMPKPNAMKLLKFMQEGKLTVTGGVQWMRLGDDGKFEAEVAYKPGNKPLVGNDAETELAAGIVTKRITADVMIDATGQSKSVKTSPLYAKAIEAGLAIAHPNGGIEADLGTHAVMGKDGPNDDLYAIGSMRSGQYINVPNSIQLSNESRDIAKALVGHMVDKGPAVRIRESVGRPSEHAL